MLRVHKGLCIVKYGSHFWCDSINTQTYALFHKIEKYIFYNWVI